MSPSTIAMALRMADRSTEPFRPDPAGVLGRSPGTAPAARFSR